MREDYIYAVARVHANELSLLSNQDIEQLMSAGSFSEAIRLLADKGWGDGTSSSPEQILAKENEKTWAFMHELLKDDMSPFDVLLFPIDYNNLKAAIKSEITQTTPHNTYISGGKIAPSVFAKAVSEKNYSLIPDAEMADAAKEAVQTFLQTSDGQLCDIILDRACLNAIKRCGNESDNEIIKKYAELTVAVSDIKIAVRSSITKKNRAFISAALAPCDTLDVNRLIVESSKSLDDLYAYLSVTDYSEAIDALRDSYSQFEKWCDDKIMDLIKEEKRNPFTFGPLFAYVIARQNEISMVRIILLGKLNDLPNEIIRERMRDMYV